MGQHEIGDNCKITDQMYQDSPRPYQHEGLAAGPAAQSPTALGRQGRHQVADQLEMLGPVRGDQQARFNHFDRNQSGSGLWLRKHSVTPGQLNQMSQLTRDVQSEETINPHEVRGILKRDGDARRGSDAIKHSPVRTHSPQHAPPATSRHSPSHTALSPDELHYFEQLRRHSPPPLPDSVYQDQKVMDGASKVYRDRISAVLNDIQG